MSDEDPQGTLRLDKWLWFTRFCKSRSLAAKLCSTGRVRLSGRIVTKAHQIVRIGDVLTFPLGPHIRVIEVKALGERRGPPAEARTLYLDLSPAPPRSSAPTPSGAREPGAGRPTKAERRATDRLKSGEEGSG
ncbi:MAG: RNA-binding S4 domain-containing protein [Proteobacteria bacterium]|nr:RNA-binding S4 domain-containing protein [Pseudomonadota bacterium]MBI3495696.1 RNA-binding S4 domain-containing protein [Pseudomonadota bacterium]